MLRIVVPKEEQVGERRVALDPATAVRFARAGCDVIIAQGAGEGSHFPDSAYADPLKVTSRDQAWAMVDALLSVRVPRLEAIEALPDGCLVVGLLSAHNHLAQVEAFRRKRITALAMELVPRISRAQSMDALSSQAAVAGYHAALQAAENASVFFPMLTTAAGTVRPAKVVVIGAGVAGLQAIATARRLGAQVEAYDIRAAAREQVASLGAKMIETGVDASGEGGYARELTEEEKATQAEALAKHLAQAHAVISTAAIPGRVSPRIITQEMVERMRPGAVIIDLAAEGGGNCELTQPGETIEHQGVRIIGPLDVASRLAVHASEMYAHNLFNLLSPFISEGELKLDFNDAVIGPMCLTRDGQVVNESLRTRMEDAS
ncbi:MULTISPECIES: NAD(P) transhydrogenase subunit alpha [Halomonadaceae]|uniref:NAD(P) transhydrogenase subunit alpha n=1 Tax=Halomonadaceae TaxID=28256 RepID=UPI001597930E|nr:MULTISPECIES: NAD(P) transhydrogenase subunit alpha [Halomonas]QJQ95333.1 NAD(P) transhydrogenase subunit alpha [Halomonas sp. PA5]